MLVSDSMSGGFLFSTEVNLNDALIRLHLVHRAFAENMALMQDRHCAGNLADKNHVVLDDDDAVLARKTHKQLTSLVRLFVSHASRRFIDQEQLWVLRQEHPDFEPL